MFGEAGNGLFVAFRAVVLRSRKMAGVVTLTITLRMGRTQHDVARGAADVPPSFNLPDIDGKIIA